MKKSNTKLSLLMLLAALSGKLGAVEGARVDDSSAPTKSAQAETSNIASILSPEQQQQIIESIKRKQQNASFQKSINQQVNSFDQSNLQSMGTTIKNGEQGVNDVTLADVTNFGLTGQLQPPAIKTLSSSVTDNPDGSVGTTQYTNGKLTGIGNTPAAPLTYSQRAYNALANTGRAAYNAPGRAVAAVGGNQDFISGQTGSLRSAANATGNALYNASSDLYNAPGRAVAAMGGNKDFISGQTGSLRSAANATASALYNAPSALYNAPGRAVAAMGGNQDFISGQTGSLRSAANTTASALYNAPSSLYNAFSAADSTDENDSLNKTPIISDDSNSANEVQTPTDNSEDSQTV